MNSRFSPLAVAAFEAFFRPWMRRRLDAVLLAGLPHDLPADRTLILVSNHVSWWDGFALREVQRLLRPRAALLTLMLEDQLRRVPWFRWMGVVGFDPGSPTSFARALRQVERQAREQPGSVVAFFPQGRIWPSFRRPLAFARGVELLARRLAPARVLPLGLHLEPLRSPAPTLLAAAARPVDVPGPDDAPTAARLERAVEEQLDRLLAFLATHGEDAAERWPGPGRPLPPVGEGAGVPLPDSAG